MTTINININLIPPEIYAKRRAEKVIVYIIFGFATVILFLITIYMFNSLRIAQAEQTLENKQKENKQITDEIVKLEPYKQRKDLANQKEQIINTALDGEIKYFKLLNELAIVIPTNAKVENIALSQKTLTFSGGVIDVPGDYPDKGFKDLVDFWVKIEQVDSIDNTFIGNYATDGSFLPYSIMAEINTKSPSLQ